MVGSLEVVGIFSDDVCGLAVQGRYFLQQFVVVCISFDRVLEQWLGGWRLDISKVLSNIGSFGRCPISFGWSAGVEMWI